MVLPPTLSLMDHFYCVFPAETIQLVKNMCIIKIICHVLGINKYKSEIIFLSMVLPLWW